MDNKADDHPVADYISKTGEKIGMTVLGIINNLFFLIVMASGPRIVDHFHKTGYLGLVTWSVSFFGLFAGYYNTLLSTKSYSYDYRFILNACAMLAGLIGVSFSTNFYVACFFILFVGFSCNFGESVAIGYLAYIKKESLVKFWSVGTSIAGILGGAYSILCLVIKFDYKISFYSLTPLIFIYIMCYFCLLRQKKDVIDPTPLISEVSEGEALETGVSCCSFPYLKSIFYYIATLGITYFCQYTIIVAFLDCAHTQDQLKKYKFLYPSLTLVKHFGVLTMTSSLTWFKCTRLELISFGQFLNFCIWLSQAMLHWSPLWLEFILIYLVGCLGGLSYVNTYNMILVDPKLTNKEREVGTNLTALSVTISVLLASAFSLLSENTYLKPFVPPSD